MILSKKFNKGQKVEFVAGNGKKYAGTYLRKFSPARGAGQHHLIDIGGGVKASIFANGAVGQSVKAV